MKQASSIADLTRSRDYFAGLVAEAERERLRLRGGDPVKLREHDQETVALRLGFAEALLALSMARRDAGDHQGAVDAARLYAEQEHLAKSLRDAIGMR